jgi:FkbM family methyltransferase
MANRESTAIALQNIVRLIDSPIVVVDVGAQSLKAEDHVYARLHQLDLPVRVIGFEPLVDRAIARRKEERGRDTEIIEAFVGDGEERTFYEMNSSGASSLLPLNAELCAGFMSLTALHTVRTQKIQTSLLDELLADLPAIDFLKLDIQGFELAALTGANSVLTRTAVVQCETEFIPVYLGQPLFSEVEIYLRARGFNFIDFHAPGYRAPVVPSGRARNEQLLWADSIFCVRPQAASDRALLTQAILAIALYHKVSIAERALATYDGRHGTFLADIAGAIGD